MAFPLLPLFVVGALQAPAIALGAIEGVAQLAVSLLAYWSGRGSDTAGRRIPFIRWGYGLPVVGKALVAAAVAWPMVLVGRTIDRVGKGMRGAPRDALVADAVDSDQLGRAFGLHRAMDTAGAMLGSLLAASALYWLGNEPSPSSLRIVLGIAAVCSIASLAATFLLHEPPHRARPEAAQPIAEQPPMPTRVSTRFATTLAILVVFALANSSDAFLMLRLADLGLSPVAVVLCYGLANLVYALAAYPFGAVSDRIGRRRVIIGGWIVYALVYAGFAVGRLTTVVWLIVLYGACLALIEGVSKALLTELSPSERRGTALGIFHASIGTSALLGNLTAGWLWQSVGHAAPFWFGAAAATAAALLLLLDLAVHPSRPRTAN